MLSGMTLKPSGGGMKVKRKRKGANPWIQHVKKVAKEAPKAEVKKDDVEAAKKARRRRLLGYA